VLKSFWTEIWHCWSKTKGGLSDPSGPISEAVPSSSIKEANKEVSAELALIDEDSGKKCHAAYMIVKLHVEQKAKIGQYAAEMVQQMQFSQ